jgi:group I intron endonuclease
MIIYLITNLVNGKYYVGKTERSILIRWGEHCSCKHEDVYKLHRAIKKYGANSFIIEVLGTCTSLNQLNQLEELWIRLLESYTDQFGYNMTMGGDGGAPTEEVRMKISLALKGRKAPWVAALGLKRRGTKLSESTKINMRIAAKNKPPRQPYTQETKEKMSANRKGKGTQPRSEETKRRMSITRAKLWEDPIYRQKAHQAAIKNYEKARQVRLEGR